MDPLESKLEALLLKKFGPVLKAGQKVYHALDPLEETSKQRLARGLHSAESLYDALTAEAKQRGMGARQAHDFIWGTMVNARKAGLVSW